MKHPVVDKKEAKHNMAMIQCPECGKDVSDMAAACPNCGCPISQQQAPAPAPSGVRCPKCKGTNISYQVIQSGSVGASTNKVVVETKVKKSKGCLYWCIIGWWMEPMIWLFTVPFKAIFGGKSKAGLNVNASKIISKTKAVCQNCGYTWVK